MANADNAHQDREIVERALATHGLTADAWENDADNGDRPTAKLGRWIVIEDDEDRGLYEGDEGELTCTAVGATEHGNLQSAFYFRGDGLEVGERVDPFEDIEPV